MNNLHQYHYERTGHLLLDVSDFGWWSCDACGKNGDDWDDPKDLECVEVDFYEI